MDKVSLNPKSKLRRPWFDLFPILNSKLFQISFEQTEHFLQNRKAEKFRIWDGHFGNPATMLRTSKFKLVL